MNKAAKKHNLNFNRFPAFHGKKINIDDFIKKNIITKFDKKPGDLGCALSHIHLWKECVKNNH